MHRIIPQFDQSGSVSTGEASIGDRLEYADGRVPETLNSWSAEYPKYANQLSYDRTKGCVAISVDSHTIETYDEFLPRMLDRGLPWAINGNGTRVPPDEDTHMSLDQLQEAVSLGAEIRNYGAPAHSPLDEMSEEEQVEAIVETKREWEEAGFSVSGWASGGGHDINEGDLDTFKSHLLRSHYQTTLHGFASSPHRHAGCPMTYGIGNGVHLDSMDVAEAKQRIDRVVHDNGKLEVFGHAHHIDDNDRWNEVDEILDHIEMHRDNGDLDVATPTAMHFLPRDLDAINLFPEPSFEFVDNIDDSTWIPYEGWNRDGAEIRTDGGRTGDNYVAMGGPIDPNNTIGGLELTLRLGPQIPNMMIEGYCKAPAGETGTLYVRVYSSHDDWDDYMHSFDIDDNWTHFRAPIGWGRLESQNRIAFWAIDNEELHLDDIAFYPC